MIAIGNEWKFKSEIKDTAVYGLAKFLKVPDANVDETYRPTSYVDYSLEPELRSWGCKGIYVHIHKITTSIDWEVFADEVTPEEKQILLEGGAREFRNENIGNTIDVDSSLLENDGWEMRCECEFEPDGSLIFGNIEIDFENKTITIN